MSQGVEPWMPIVGNKVRELRGACGWTQVQLAVYAGINPSTVNLIEHGHRNPNAVTLQKLAHALGVEPGALFAKESVPEGKAQALPPPEATEAEEAYVDLGSRIRAARKIACLTQEALARRADVSHNLINRIERAETRDPHVSTLAGIANALGVSVSELMGESEPATPKAQPPNEDLEAENERLKQVIKSGLVEKMVTAEAGALSSTEGGRRMAYCHRCGWWLVAEAREVMEAWGNEE